MKPRLILLAFALGMGGCAARTHLTESHGQSVSTVMSRQVANPTAGETPRPIPGLDAQEASIVARNYRRSLSTKSPSRTDDQGMLILAPPAQGAQPYVPPPSVPERP